jgi:hypothetical protein
VCLVEDKNIIIHTEKEYLRGRKWLLKISLN